MITKFISANPVLSAAIIIGILALIYYMVKRSKGQTNSPNNIASGDPSGANPGTTGSNAANQRLHELILTNAPDRLTTAIVTDPNAAKTADMASKSARNVPAGVH